MEQTQETGPDRRLVISPPAGAGDLDALVRDVAAAGWELKITQREPEWLASNGVTIELTRYEEASGGTPMEAWFGPPDERGTSEFRTPETPDAWYADRKTRSTGTAPTVERACTMVAEAVERYEGGLKVRSVDE